jgi:hypothetical protein
MSIKVKVVVDLSQANTELEDWQKESAKRIGDATGSWDEFGEAAQRAGKRAGLGVDAAEKAAQKVVKLQAELNRLVDKADFNYATASLDELRQRAEQTEGVFAQARAKVVEFSQTLSDVDVSTIDPEAAKKAADEFAKLNQEAKTAFAEAQRASAVFSNATRDSADEITHLKEEIKEVAPVANQTEQYLKELVAVEKFERARSVYSDVRDIFDIMAQNVLDLSDAQAQAASQSAYLAEKGLAIGAAFGTAGAVLGTLVGVGLAVSHWFTEAGKESDETTKQINELTEQIREANRSFASLNEADLSSVVSQVVSLQKELDKLPEYSEKAQREIKILAEKGVEGLAKGYDALINKGLRDEFQLQGKSLEDLLDLEAQAKSSHESLIERAKLRKKAQEELTGTLDATAEGVEFEAKTLRELDQEITQSLARQDALRTSIDAVGQAAAIAAAHKEKYHKATKSSREETEKEIDALEKLTGLVRGDVLPALTAINIARQGYESPSGKKGFFVAVEEGAEAAIAAIDPAIELLEYVGDAFATYEDVIENISVDLGTIGDEFRNLPDIATPFYQAGEAASFFAEALDAALRNGTVLTTEMLQAVDALTASLATAFGQTIQDAASALFDNIQAGERPFKNLGKAIRASAAEQLKGIGTNLIGEGVSNELKAAAMAILSFGADPRAVPLALLGAAEIAAGLAMGGTGALIGRGTGGGADKSPSSTATEGSLGSREAEASGPTQLAPVQIFLGPQTGMAVFAGDQRGVAEYGRFTADAVKMGSKAPR